MAGTGTMSRPARWTLLVGCCAQVMLTINSTTTSVAIPSIQRDLHASALELAWIQNAYVLALAAFMPLCGAIGDRFGRKRVYLAGFAVFTLGSLLSGLAPGPWTLVLTRAVQGCGGAAMSALGLSLLAMAFGDRLGRATGVWAASSSIGLTLGPVVGGVLVDTVGWRSVFYVNVPICIVAVIPAVRFIPESADAARKHVDAPGGVLLAASLVGLVATLHSLHVGAGYSPVETVVPGAVTVAAFSGFWWRERRVADPVLPFSLFARRRFRAAVVIALSVNFALAGSLYFQSLTMQNDRGWSPLAAGMMLLPLNAGIAAGGLRSSRLVDRYGVATVTASALFAAAAGAALLTGLGFGIAAPVIAVADLLIGLGLGLAFPAVSAVGMHEVDLRHIGVASATLSDGRQVGGSIGIAVLVSVMVGTTGLVWSRRGAAAGLSAGQISSGRSAIEVGNVSSVTRSLGAAAGHAAQHSFAWGIAALYLTSATLLVATGWYALLALRAGRQAAPAIAT
ncbi:MAG: MFS transporter [Acidimicrobiales bacterium]